MTKKQIRKYANEIIKLEKIHSDTSNDKEMIADAERRILQLTNQISCLPNGLEVLMEIDEIIYSALGDKGNN